MQGLNRPCNELKGTMTRRLKGCSHQPRLHPCVSSPSRTRNSTQPVPPSSGLPESSASTEPEDPWAQWYQGYGHGWSWSSQDWNQSQAWSRRSTSWTPVSTSAHLQLLPDFVQGWFLPQDSTLESSEKNMILAALNLRRSGATQPME